MLGVSLWDGYVINVISAFSVTLMVIRSERNFVKRTQVFDSEFLIKVPCLTQKKTITSLLTQWWKYAAVELLHCFRGNSPSSRKHPKKIKKVLAAYACPDLPAHEIEQRSWKMTSIFNMNVSVFMFHFSVSVKRPTPELFAAKWLQLDIKENSWARDHRDHRSHQTWTKHHRN